MKNVMLTVVFLFTLTLQIFGFENAQIDKVLNNEQGVYLLINEGWLKTDGLQVFGEDAFVCVKGEWLTLQEAIEFGDFQVAWRCSKCKSYNMDGVKTCPYCGKPKNA